MPTLQTPFLVLISILIVILIYIVLRPVKRYPLGNCNGRYVSASLLCIAFCVFSFWDTDWFHYLNAFDDLKAGYSGHMEEVYVWIAQNLSPNYYSFRLVVWGIAFLLFLRTIQLLSVSKPLTLFFFGTIYIVWFSYARVSLSMALVLYGTAILYGNKKKSVGRCVLAVALIIISFFFHKTALFAILVFVIAAVSEKYPKVFVWLMLLAFPLALVLVKTQLSSFISMDFDGIDSDMSEYMSAGQGYMEKDLIKRGLGAFLQRTLEIVPYYGITFVCIKELKGNRLVPQNIQVFMLIQIITVLISSIFAFDLGINTTTIYIRFMRFAAIPTSIVMAYCYEHRLSYRLTKIFIMLASLGTSYTMLYSLYNSLV